MRVLVLGAGGMAGHIVAIRLAEYGYEITGLARRQLPFCKTLVVDVHNIEKSVLLSDYDAVVNCIGVLIKTCENNPADAVWINSYLPRLLAKLTVDSKTKIIHLSTDCVFSGSSNGGYMENSLPDAEYLYGRSKALGELNDSKNLTFRTSIVGPDINEKGTGLFNWFMKQNGVVDGYSKAIWTGVTTFTLTYAIKAALEQDITGLYHLVNNERISKLELLELFSTLRQKPIQIIPNGTVQENKSLINTRSDFHFTIPSYADMVNEMNKWILRHKDMYPQYETR